MNGWASSQLHTNSKITGTGLVTPLGDDVTRTWSALLEGRFIEDHARTDVSDCATSMRITRLARQAALEAWTNAGWSQSIEPYALILGTSKGPVESWISPAGLSDVGDPLRFTWGLDACAHELNALLPRPAAVVGTVSAACASGLHALIDAALLLRSGAVSRAMVVAAEASVHPLFLSSFKRLGVLPKFGIGCRPFDTARDGFLMSDAAAAVCLERVDHGNSGSIQTRAVHLDRFALAGDAAHLTSADPRGAALKNILHQVLADRRVDLIHAHGTGTPVNDPIELAAIECQLTQGDRPWVYSHKGALGHSLGAAGLVSVVLSVEMHHRSVILPNVRTTDPIAHERVRIDNEAQNAAITRSICIAAGFGGALAGVSLVSA